MIGRPVETRGILDGVKSALLAVALGASGPGCQAVFPLDHPVDEVPHVRPDDELAGDLDLAIPAGERYSLDTQSLAVVGNNFQGLEPTVSVQPGVNTDLVILAVKRLVVEGTLVITGEARPLVIIAETIEVSGVIDASAEHTTPGPGGGRSGDHTTGEGGPGGSAGTFGDNNSGGGGGGFGGGAAPGGQVVCDNRSVEGGLAGDVVGDDPLTVLAGGGAGGRGGSLCDLGVIAEGGGGGGAIQLTASESISIASTGQVIAGGGGGDGGLGTGSCQDRADGGGAGGGAGGAIYLDAATIINDGTLTAHGGGGGAGGQGGTAGAAGNPGVNANATGANASGGGLGVGKGTSGGRGANPTGSAGSPGVCGTAMLFNTGGGGGGVGRIVLRGDVERIGTISPPPKLLARPAF